MYEAQHPPVQMDKNVKCDLKFCDQYCLCYIELYEAQHPPVQMYKCDLKFCDQCCLCYIKLYEAQHPPVQVDKNINLSAILILWLVLFVLHRTVWGATPASSDG